MDCIIAIKCLSLARGVQASERTWCIPELHRREKSTRSRDLTIPRHGHWQPQTQRRFWNSSSVLLCFKNREKLDSVVLISMRIYSSLRTDVSPFQRVFYYYTLTLCSSVSLYNRLDFLCLPRTFHLIDKLGLNVEDFGDNPERLLFQRTGPSSNLLTHTVPQNRRNTLASFAPFGFQFTAKVMSFFNTRTHKLNAKIKIEDNRITWKFTSVAWSDDDLCGAPAKTC